MAMIKPFSAIRPLLQPVEPGSNQRLEYIDDDQGWALLHSKLAKNENLIAFTLYAMSSTELMACADQWLMLPLKSSCILPKATFGLLMHDLDLEKELAR